MPVFIRSLLMPRLAVLVLMAGAVGTLAGQEPPDKALTQLRGLNVLIEPLAFAGPADTSVRFDSLGLKYAAQRRLAEAGMRVVSDSQWSADPSLPLLDIEASLVRDSISGDFIFCVTAMVYQEVVADHDEHLLAA